MITLLEFLLKKHIDIDPEAVDLGLPSGTLWCSHNVGANTPEDYGDFFAWGETESKQQFTEQNYKYNDGSLENIKYNNDTKLKLLLPEDDAATANMGKEYHMPTLDQVLELLKETNVDIHYKLNDVPGVKYSSKKNKDIFIFIPKAGYGDNIRKINLRGNESCVWTNDCSLDYHSPYYFGLNYYSSKNKVQHSAYWLGFSVRAVKDE